MNIKNLFSTMNLLSDENPTSSENVNPSLLKLRQRDILELNSGLFYYEVINIIGSKSSDTPNNILARPCTKNGYPFKEFANKIFKIPCPSNPVVVGQTATSDLELNILGAQIPRTDYCQAQGFDGYQYNY